MRKLLKVVNSHFPSSGNLLLHKQSKNRSA